MDLTGSAEGKIMLETAEVVFGLSEELYNVDQEELMKYAFNPPESLIGYVLPRLSVPRSAYVYLPNQMEDRDM